jgi:myo-inositol-1-phosphate synthase
MSKSVNVAVVGVGNCCSSLVQGVGHYVEPGMAGLMNWEIGGLTPSDIEFVCAWDVDESKVGLDLSQAIHAGRNNTIDFCPVGPQLCTVQRGPTMDGLGTKYRERVVEGNGDLFPVTGQDEYVKQLQGAGADVLVSYLPVGSRDATRYWAQVALNAGVGFVNCIPEFIASSERSVEGGDGSWLKDFEDAGIPLLGDDIKSQFGATITHRMLTRLMEDRAIHLDKTYQLNFGGNMDFYNMLNSERLDSKKQSKRDAVTTELGEGREAQVHISPSDYVEWLEDQKWCYIRMEGSAFGGVPLRLEMKLEVWDSPNSAGCVIDLVRIAKAMKDRGMGGFLREAAWYFKSPPNQVPDDECRAALAEWITESNSELASTVH